MKNRLQRLTPAAVAALTYLALWGSLSHMAGIGTAGILPLTPGFLAAAVIALLPARLHRGWVSLGVSLLALPLLLWGLEGVKLLLNRLMLASMAEERYLYELFPVQAAEPNAALRLGLLPLGLLTGGLAGLRRGTLPAFLGFALGAAWLGLSPSLPWLLLWALALGLGLTGPALGVLLPALAAAALLLALFPGEDVALSHWEEATRDRLAGETLAYADPAAQTPPETAPTPEAPPLLAEEAADAGRGGDLVLPTPPPALVILLLLALLLFLPSLWADNRRKKREKRRSGLESDPKRAFLYALDWLEYGGFRPGNRPLAALLPELPEELREAYREALPLWGEAVWSDHTPTAAQCAHMLAFAEQAEQAVWHRLSRPRRWLARYGYGL